MPSQTKENYLKAIFSLSLQNKEVNLSELSREMGVSVPTVNSMVKKLQEKQWVKYEKYKPLRITKKGESLAAQIIRKHRLSEMFLAKIMGFGWEEVHDIAEQMEHIDSEPFFDRMDELLSYPTMDPHGSPIPSKNGAYVEKHYLSLSETQLNDTYRLCALKDSSFELLSYLNELTVKLGQEFTVLKRTNFDGSMTLKEAALGEIQLSKQVCDCLLVEEV